MTRRTSTRSTALGGLLLLGVTAAPSVARAQDRPVLLPTRDVDITYDVPDGARTLQQRMRWDVADRLLRVDPPDAGTYIIVDYADNCINVVRDGDRSVLQVPVAHLQLPGANGGSFTRLGDASIAGLACTEWQTTDNSGALAQVCVTGDGVLLRASAGDRVLLQASSVAFAAQPAAAFHAPADYRYSDGPAQP